MRPSTFLSIALAGIATVALASSPSISVSAGWARAMPPGARVAAGYLTLDNTSARADRLLAVTTRAAARVELHMVRKEGGVMRMQALRDGVLVPAHGRVIFAPFGLHLMLMDPRSTLRVGDSVSVELHFELAGVLPATLQVVAIDAAAPDAARAEPPKSAEGGAR